MHEDTITTVVIVVMVIQIWRIKSKFSFFFGFLCNNSTWLSFSPIWITPILSTVPFERLHSKVNQITSPRPDPDRDQKTSFSWSYFAPSQKCQPDSAMRVSTFACSYLLKNILAHTCWEYSNYSRTVMSWGQCLSLIHELWRRRGPQLLYIFVQEKLHTWLILERPMFCHYIGEILVN